MNKVADFLESLGCFSVKHSGRSLGEHLMGTHAILQRAGLAESVQLAGALHSIYGTNAFTKTTLPYTVRHKVAEDFGPRAEYLAYVFSRLNRPYAIEHAVFNDRETGEPLEISISDMMDLGNIEAANLAEQKADMSRYPILQEWSRRLATPRESQQMSAPAS